MFGYRIALEILRIGVEQLLLSDHPIVTHVIGLTVSLFHFPCQHSSLGNVARIDGIESVGSVTDYLH